MFVDLAPSSTLGTAWSPMSFVVDAASAHASPFAESRASVDAYFGAYESLMKQGMNGTPSGGDSTARTMR
jgi:hypothetical protein